MKKAPLAGCEAPGRRFPFFEANNSIAKPTSQKKILKYKLYVWSRGGETIIGLIFVNRFFGYHFLNRPVFNSFKDLTYTAIFFAIYLTI